MSFDRRTAQLAVLIGWLLMVTVYWGSRVVWFLNVAVGVMVPFVRSLRALQRAERDHLRGWLTYWIIVAVLYIVHRSCAHQLRHSMVYPIGVLFVLLLLSGDEAYLCSLIRERKLMALYKNNEELVADLQSEAGSSLRHGLSPVLNLQNASPRAPSERSVPSSPSPRPSPPSRAPSSFSTTGTETSTTASASPLRPGGGFSSPSPLAGRPPRSPARSPAAAPPPSRPSSLLAKSRLTAAE